MSIEGSLGKMTKEVNMQAKARKQHTTKNKQTEVLGPYKAIY